MQNLANITSTEVAFAGSAVLVLCVAPTVLAWSDARRRRKALAQAAALEAAARDAAARDAAAREAAARDAAVLALSTPTAGGMEFQQLWDEPTVTLDAADVLAAPPALAEDAALFEVPVEPANPATSEAAPADGPPPADEPAPPADEPAPVPPAELSEPQPPAETPHFAFCLQELRRVRLPNWPPPEIHADAVRSEVWRDAERLAAHHQREIGTRALVAPHPVQSSCLGSAEADAAGMRLRFFLFPVLWPATEEQATAEAVFEIDRTDGTIRSSVNSLKRLR